LPERANLPLLGPPPLPVIPAETGKRDAFVRRRTAESIGKPMVFGGELITCYPRTGKDQAKNSRVRAILRQVILRHDKKYIDAHQRLREVEFLGTQAGDPSSILRSFRPCGSSQNRQHHAHLRGCRLLLSGKVNDDGIATNTSSHSYLG